MRDLVEGLQRLGDLRHHVDEVSELLVEARPALPDGLEWRRGGYTRNLVHRDRGFEVLLVCWSAGAVTPVHDHGDQECWFLPLHGAFDLEDFGPSLSLIGRRERVCALDHSPGQIHRVRLSAGVSAAVSLHVYAAAVDRCRIFDVRTGRYQWTRLDYDARLEQVLPVW